MIGILLGINMLLICIIGLATAMLQHHFHKIEKSLQIYANPKAYKPKSNIVFINCVMERIKKLEGNGTKLADIEHIIQGCFYEQKIGYFSYVLVQNIAIKGKFFMWGILAIQIGVEVLSRTPGKSISHFIFIVGSTLICMFATLLAVVRNVSEQRAKLLIHIQDYIINIYPTEISKRAKSKDFQELLEKIDRLEIEGVSLGTTEEEEVDNNMPLKEEDIMLFLQKLDKEA